MLNTLSLLFVVVFVVTLKQLRIFTVVHLWAKSTYGQFIFIF